MGERVQNLLLNGVANQEIWIVLMNLLFNLLV